MVSFIVLNVCTQHRLFVVAGMFDKDMSGTISINEFQELWTYINQWKGAFDRFDSNRSGAIDSNELMNGRLQFPQNLTGMSLAFTSTKRVPRW